MHSFIAKSRLLALTVLLTLSGALATLPGAASAAQFGLASFNSSLSTTQAGAHADFTTAFTMNTDALGNPVEQLKNVHVDLPPGIIGDPQAVPKCTGQQFQEFNCPADSQVGVVELSVVTCRGVATTLTAPAEAGAVAVSVADGSELCGEEPDNQITIGTGSSTEQAKIAFVNGNELLLEEPLAKAHTEGESVTHIGTPDTAPAGVFNMQPSPGHLATLAASVVVGTTMFQVDLRKDGSYGLETNVSDLSTLLIVQGTSLTLWGVPTDPSHDSLRCGQLDLVCGPSGAAPAAFMTNPMDCAAGPMAIDMSVESWQGSDASGQAQLPAVTGCERLLSQPALAITPDTTQADTPAGYTTGLQVPQNGEPYELATPDLKNVSVTLPAGTALAPGVANGLQGCSSEQFAANTCPEASKVGVAEVQTPDLPDRLTGPVYLGTPVPGETYRVFALVSGDNATVRLYGHVEPNPSSGQITAVFNNNPQVPFSNFELKLFGGPGASLVNPLTCGPATTTSSIEAFSGQVSNPSSSFVVDANGAGAACPASWGFSPSLSAGTTNPVAGAFSPFVLTLSRGDQQQRFASVTTQLPEGLLGTLKSVVQCGEAQANAGTCGPESLIGHTTAGSGAGAEPFFLGGQVFLTGPYGGAPFGLSIVVPAIAGPFDLGMVVVRAKIMVDPHTAVITVVSNPLPTILEGIPLDLRTINVTLDRPGFTFNPTSCQPMAVGATVTSTEGASASLSNPFQATNCAGLGFGPKLAATTLAKTSKQIGAALDVKVIYPSAGAQSNIHSVAVELPKQLPARLTTIQKACLEATFAANPASCDPRSMIGTATATTPLLANPLTGPAYLVSHGGAQFPDVVMILQGEGVMLQIVGNVFIAKSGITSTTFAHVPDAPVSSFDLNLPQGPHSALAPNGSLCTSPLILANTITAQNGLQIKANTRISVSGCASAKAKKHKRKKHSAKKKKH